MTIPGKDQPVQVDSKLLKGSLVFDSLDQVLLLLTFEILVVPASGKQ